MHRWIRPVTIALALAAGAAACGDPSPTERTARERAQQARQVALDARLGDDVADIVADAAAAVGATYRVTYAGATADAPTVTVTQEPPRRRIDVDPGAVGVARTALTAGDASTTCTRIGGDWACRPGETPPELAGFAERDLTATAQALGRARDDYDFRVEERELVGVDARCLVTTRKPGRTNPRLGERATMCISSEGVLLLVERPGAAALRATAYTTDLPGDAFDLPADPSPDR